MIGALRQASFLNNERARIYPRLLLAGFAVALAWLLFTAHGLSDYAGRPLGSDFSSFYAAGRLMLAGHSPYDQAALRNLEQSLFGNQTPFYSFAYPPIFLLLLTPLARLPYLPALALWQGATLALYLWAMLRLKKRWGAALPGGAFFMAASLAFTAVFINLVHGQNGFLCAGLIALGLSALDDNALLAGICFGLLAFKPQLGLMLPFALAAGGRWKSFVAAALSVSLLVALSTILFGMESWRDFFAATAFSQTAILDQGAVGFEKMVSLFAWARLWHLPLNVAYAIQAVAALAVTISLIQLWRSAADPRLKGAALIFASLLVTPFALDYDLMLLGPAILLLAAAGQARGFLPYQASLCVLIWLLPAAAPGLAQWGLPAAAMATAFAYLFTLHAARHCAN